jgi:uncharacterized membrane protein
MIFPILAWGFLSTLLGLLAFPFAFRVFPRLADRGYALSRSLGVLGAGYLLWMGTSLGILRNDFSGALAAVLGVALASVALSYRNRREIGAWMRQKARTIQWTELLFALAFVGWALVRAANPEIVATEKPMELAFVNAILRSPTFPPADPWLSGYAISYYYFGYVLVAMLSRLTGTSAGVAFNLANALWFALACLGAWSILLSLLGVAQRGARHAAALLGPLFVIVTANLEGFLEVLWSAGLFWRTGADGQPTSWFWQMLDIKDLNQPPTAATGLIPDRFLWWWRASRVIHDRNLAGASIEVIDEFPFFSFLLADNHPHLLALPFVLLAVAFVLQIFLEGERQDLRLRPPGEGVSDKALQRTVYALLGAVLGLALVRGLWVFRAEASAGAGLGAAGGVMIAGGLVVAIGTAVLAMFGGKLPSLLRGPEILVAAWLFGALAVLNTWDLPIYLSLLFLVLYWQASGSDWLAGMGKAALASVIVLILSLVAYFPWYPTFASQLSGILPNLFFPTRLPQFAVMFGAMLLPLGVWLAWRAGEGWRRRDTWVLLAMSLGIPVFLWLVAWLLSGVAMLADPLLLQEALGQLGAASLNQATQAALQRRLTDGWTSVLLSALVGLAALIFLRLRRSRPVGGKPPNAAFVLAMMAIGVLMILGPEFVYLRDLFGTRMNTVFKLYFAAWILLGLSTAYVAVDLWPRSSSWRGALRTLSLLPLMLGLVYPILATWTKTNAFRPPGGLTLDGTAHLAVDHPQDEAAIRWIDRYLPEGVLAEAVGGSYTEFGRVATHTGFPTVLGWEFHEFQWRGTMEPQGSRKEDIRRLFETRDPSELASLLNRYQIDYVYIGPLERATYTLTQAELAKFPVLMDLIYATEDVEIYARRSKRGF